MTTEKAIAIQGYLRMCGVTIWVYDRRLHYHWRLGTMTPEIMQLLREQREALVEALQKVPRTH